jgi:hypothetical protein
MLPTSRTSQPAYGETVTIEIVYETHSTTEDNERGIATGWSTCCLTLVKPIAKVTTGGSMMA